MDYTNAEIDAKIAQAVMDTLTFVGTQYVKQDGSTSITGIQRIEKVNTDAIKNYSNDVDFECVANFKGKVILPDSFQMKSNANTLTVISGDITIDREVHFPDNDGTIDVNP